MDRFWRFANSGILQNRRQGWLVCVEVICLGLEIRQEFAKIFNIAIFTNIVKLLAKFCDFVTFLVACISGK